MTTAADQALFVQEWPAYVSDHDVDLRGIDDPRMLAALGHWNELAAARQALPRWREVDVTQMWVALGYINLVDINRATPRQSTVRILGERTAIQVSGSNIKNRRMPEFHRDHTYVDMVERRIRLLMASAQPQLYEVQARWHRGFMEPTLKRHQCLMLPLAEDGITVDGYMSVYSYRDQT